MIKEFSRLVIAAFPDFASTGKIAHIGVEFDPPANGQWLEIMTFNSGSNDYAIGSTSIERGFFRVVAGSRLGANNMLQLETLANQVADAFPKGSRFGIAVTDARPSLSGIIISGDRAYIPVTIRWRTTRH